MYRRFAVDGLRGLRDLSIDQLARVNLITGLNGSGKTTVLEALSLHSKPFDIQNLLQFDGFRIGIGTPFAGNIVPGVGGRSPLHRLFGAGERLIVEGQYGDRTWSVSLKEQPGTATAEPQNLLPASLQGQLSVPVNPLLGALEIRVDEGEHAYFLTAQFFQNGSASWGQAMGTDADAPSASSNRIAASARNSNLLAAQYSTVVGTIAEELVLKIAQKVEPRLKRLTVWTNGQFAAVHGDVGTESTLDLALISDGLFRVVSVAVAVSQSANGICLIDEFENGVHVSVLRDVWAGVYSACRAFNVQLFATTHSKECAQAAFSTFGDSGEFLLHRIDMYRGRSKVETFDSEMLDSAFAAGLEIR